ncbi:MAG: hypothetical protein HRU12_23685 [Phaeodactylibacter sp.]|nr:hypothetical protein [Phaeodactylibacter sp.]
MCDALTTTYTAAQILQGAGNSQGFGRFSLEAIDAYIAAEPETNEIELAKLDIQNWVAASGINTGTLSAQQCGLLRKAIQFFTAYRFSKIDMSERECSEIDYKRLEMYADRTCDFLGRVDPELATAFEAWKADPDFFKPLPELDGSVFFSDGTEL